MNAAYTALMSDVLGNNASIDFYLDAGTHSYSIPILVQGPFSAKCNVVGAAPVSTTVTSVQSSSGSRGAWSFVLNVGSVAGISAGQYAVISATSGGTLPEGLCGCWPITNVNSGSSQITISTPLQSSTIPSGSITGTLVVPQTIISCRGQLGHRPCKTMGAIDCWPRYRCLLQPSS